MISEEVFDLAGVPMLERNRFRDLHRDDLHTALLLKITKQMDAWSKGEIDPPVQYYTPIVTAVGSHSRECSNDDCPAKGWDTEDYVHEFTTHGAMRAIDRVLHGDETEALLALSALMPALDLFLEGARVDRSHGKTRF